MWIPTSFFERIEAATIAIPDASGLPEVRFVLIVKAGQDPLEIAAAVELALAPLKARVERFSNLDHRALLLIIPGRAFKGDPGPAFEAGYELVRRFSLEAAEPEVFTDVFPEPDPRRKGPAEEAIDDFPPGCWAPEQPELDKHWAIEQIFAPAAWAASEALQRPSRGAASSLRSRIPELLRIRNWLASCKPRVMILSTITATPPIR